MYLWKESNGVPKILTYLYSTLELVKTCFIATKNNKVTIFNSHNEHLRSLSYLLGYCMHQHLQYMDFLLTSHKDSKRIKTYITKSTIFYYGCTTGIREQQGSKETSSGCKENDKVCFKEEIIQWG